MYAGHFAAALALKARQPRAPTWALLVGVALLDLLFGVFVPLGFERVTATPGVSPGFRLDFIDWSHSLAAAMFWSLLYALCFARLGAAVAYVLGVSVFSHFLLDWPMHPGDLALWPGSAAHVGLGLWRALPVGWWFVELAFVVAGCAYYAVRAKRDGTFGGRWPWACAVVLFLHVFNSPWLSPKR